MKFQQIQARFGSSAIDQGLPHEIVYIPEGEHSIFPEVDGKAKNVTVKMPREKGHQVAAILQDALKKRLGDNVRPIIDFDHKRNGAAAGLPKSFRYEQGKGIILALEWTGAGREAIEGRDYSYFSPEFLLGNDGLPGGLPAKGAIGALVNNPAFRTMPRIAAQHADVSDRKEITDALLWDGASDSKFGRAVFQSIAAGDASTIDEAQDRVMASDPEAYDEYCRSLFKKEPVVIAASQAFSDPLEEIERRGQILIAAGQAEDFDDARLKAAAADPALYDAYCRSLHKR